MNVCIREWRERGTGGAEWADQEQNPRRGGEAPELPKDPREEGTRCPGRRREKRTRARCRGRAGPRLALGGASTRTRAALPVPDAMARGGGHA